jgi:hypothetical protein
MISPEVTKDLLSVQRVLRHLPTPSDKGWTPIEAQRFWVGLARFPQGPWTEIAKFIGTKTTRQTMTHSQILRQKLKRWKPRLHRNPTARFLMDGSSVGLPCFSQDKLSHLVVKQEHCGFPTPDCTSAFNITTGMAVSPTLGIVYTEQSCGSMTPPLLKGLRPHVPGLKSLNSPAIQGTLLTDERLLDVVVEELGLVMG